MGRAGPGRFRGGGAGFDGPHRHGVSYKPGRSPPAGRQVGGGASRPPVAVAGAQPPVFCVEGCLAEYTSCGKRHALSPQPSACSSRTSVPLEGIALTQSHGTAHPVTGPQARLPSREQGALRPRCSAPCGSTQPVGCLREVSQILYQGSCKHQNHVFTMNCSVDTIRRVFNHQNYLDFRDISVRLRSSRRPNETSDPSFFSLDFTRW